MKNHNSGRQKATSQGRGDAAASTEPAKERSLQRLPTGDAVPPADSAEEVTVKRFLAQVVGVRDPDVALRIIEQVSRTQAVWPSSNALEQAQAAADMMLEIRPESVMEALLATQTIGVHHAALSFLVRTTLPAKSVQDVDVYARVAARFMRLSMEQMEAMARLKGKASRQKVTVEQVHVHDGGQAIVGAVGAAPEPEKGRGRAHAASSSNRMRKR